MRQCRVLGPCTHLSGFLGFQDQLFSFRIFCKPFLLLMLWALQSLFFKILSNKFSFNELQKFFPSLTKIVATLGAKSRSVETLEQCLKAGMAGLVSVLYHLFIKIPFCILNLLYLIQCVACVINELISIIFCFGSCKV